MDDYLFSIFKILVQLTTPDFARALDHKKRALTKTEPLEIAKNFS
ncbi:hypothetical protein DSUL_50050 [Desulfovibrionales bacterium]